MKSNPGHADLPWGDVNSRSASAGASAVLLRPLGRGLFVRLGQRTELGAVFGEEDTWG